MQGTFNDLLRKPIIAINVGLEMFASNLKDQQVELTQVDWIPPAGGDKEMVDLLDQLL